MTLKDSDILNLPEWVETEDSTPKYSAADMIRICERMLPYLNAKRYSQPQPEFIGEAFSLVAKISTEEEP